MRLDRWVGNLFTELRKGLKHCIHFMYLLTLL